MCVLHVMGQLSNLPSWLSRHPPPLLPIIVLQCQCSPRLLCNLHSSQLMIYDACARSLPGARGGRWPQIATTCGNPIWVASVHCARHTPKPDAGRPIESRKWMGVQFGHPSPKRLRIRLSAATLIAYQLATPALSPEHVEQTCPTNVK